MPLSDPAFLELCTASPAFRLVLERGADGVVELGEVFDAAGKPAGLSPREWMLQDRANIAPGGVVDGGAAGLWAIPDTALEYARRVDPRITLAEGIAAFESILSRPGFWLMRDPTEGNAQMALGVLVAEGIEPAEGRRRIIAEVIAITDGTDEMARESTVARVQRALDAAAC